MSTIRLFDAEPYAKEATAKVVSCEETEYKKVKCFACVLDRTIFFPEEGGQTPDCGTINGIKVLDVQVKDKVITHFLEAPVEAGAEVALAIDWNHRFSNMQQHSGEHIFSGSVHTMFGFDNVGFHLSDNSVTMDFNGVLTEEDIKAVERRVNEAIAANVPITAEYVDSEVLSTLTYRSKKELEGPVRIVTIPGYDSCACCAPHVQRTGEIGMLKVVHCMNYKGGVRVNILCGFRALEYYRESLALIDSLTDFLTTGRENLVEYVKKLKAENQALSSSLLTAKQDLLKMEFESIPADQQDVLIFKEKTDSVVMKNAVNMLLEKHDGMIAYFSGSDESGYSYMLASKAADCREVQKKLAENFKAKGGGKPEMVCGQVAAAESEIRKVLE